MSTWQEWVAVVVAFVATRVAWEQRNERLRSDAFKDGTQVKLEDLAVRITRVESEIVTEREVREILHDLVIPLSTALLKIEGKTEGIASDITEIKVAIAKMESDS